MALPREFDLNRLAIFSDPRVMQVRGRPTFATLAEKFEMISSRTQDVFVPFLGAGEALDKLRAIGQLTRELRHDLQRYIVGLQPWEFKTAKTTVLSEVRRESNLWIAADPSYTDAKGLELTIRPEDMIR